MNKLTSRAIITVFFVSSPLFAADFYQEGVSDYNNERFEKAIPLLEKAISIKPDNHDATYRLALAYTKTQQYRPAIGKFLSLQKFEKIYPNIYFETARNYFTLTDYENAKKYFRFSASNGYRTEECEYFIAYSDYQSRKYNPAKQGFENLLNSKIPDIKQGSYMYLGTILYLEERNNKKATFKEAKGNLHKAVAINAQTEAGSQAQAVLNEIDRRLNPDRSHSSKRWAVNGNLGLEYDTNVLTEADLMDPTRKTGKTGTKLSTGAGGSYAIIDSMRWTLKPNYSFSYGKYLTSDSVVNKNDSLSNTVILNTDYKNAMYGKPYEVPNSFSVTHSMSDSDSDGTWTWSSLSAGYSPKFKYRLFGSNYSTIGAGWTYSYVPTNKLQSNYEYKFNLSQTYSVASLSTSIDGAYKNNYIPSNHDASFKKSVWEIGASLSHPVIWKITGSTDGRFTFTDNVNNSTRGREALYNFGLNFTRVFFKLFNVTASWNYSRQTSKDQANYQYSKHLLGLKSAISF